MSAVKRCFSKVVLSRGIPAQIVKLSSARFSTLPSDSKAELPERFGFITAEQVADKVKGKDDLDGEPPRKVDPVVAEVLQATVPVFRNGRWIPGKLNPRELKKEKFRLISEGYYWPERPLRDRNMDIQPKGKKREIKKKERLLLIEENMKKMPDIVAEYRKQCREDRAKKREAARARKMNELQEMHDDFQPTGSSKEERNVKKT